MPALRIEMPKKDALYKVIQNYSMVSSRAAEDVFVDQCHRFAEELFQQTKAISPSAAQIAADVKRQGWKIPAWFAGGRIGRGEPRMWADFALQKREKRKGRPTTAEKAERDAFKAKKPTLAQMQAFVIAVRVRARLYLASGWLGALADLGGKLKKTSGDIGLEKLPEGFIGPANRRGGAIVRRAPQGIEVAFWNATPGIVEQDEKHGIVEKARATRLFDLLGLFEQRIREYREAA